jgi:hypothetical protein
VPRLGTEENAKITSAQTATRSHAERVERLAVVACVDIAES